MDACLEPSASVAGLALKRRVNANLLRKWIKLHQQRLAGTSLQPAPIGTAFVPVVEVDNHEAVLAPESAKAHRHTPAARTSSPAMASARVTVQMPNGVTLRFECSGNDAPLLSDMIETLGRCNGRLAVLWSRSWKALSARRTVASPCALALGKRSASKRCSLGGPLPP